MSHVLVCDPLAAPAGDGLLRRRTDDARGRRRPGRTPLEDRESLRAIARRFGYGTLVALLVLIATGTAMAFHFDLWSNGAFHIKLALVALVGVLLSGMFVARTGTSWRRSSSCSRWRSCGLVCTSRTGTPEPRLEREHVRGPGSTRPSSTSRYVLWTARTATFDHLEPAAGPAHRRGARRRTPVLQAARRPTPAERW